MNSESIQAFLHLGLSLLILGVVFYIPAHFWVKRKLQREPEHAKLRVTKTGFIVYGAAVVALMFGLGLIQVTGVFFPRAFVVLIIAVIFVIVERTLSAFGLKLIEEDEYK